MFSCCAGRRGAIPSLNNGQLYLDLTTGNKESLTALELLLILATIADKLPFLFGLLWVRLDTEFQIRVKRKLIFWLLDLLGFNYYSHQNKLGILLDFVFRAPRYKIKTYAKTHQSNSERLGR